MFSYISQLSISIFHHFSSGWWFQPLWKIWATLSVGMIFSFPTEWKNHIHLPNHQADRKLHAMVMLIFPNHPAIWASLRKPQWWLVEPVEPVEPLLGSPSYSSLMGSPGIPKGGWTASQTWGKWIGLRENLQETIDFPMKYGVFL